MSKLYVFGVALRTETYECPTTGVMAAASEYEACKLIHQRFPASDYRIRVVEWY